MTTALAVLLLAFSLLGWLSYLIVAKIPAMRRNMWPMWVIFDTSVVMALIALFQYGTQAGPISAAATATCASFALFVLVYVLVLRVPPAKGRPQAGELLPAFVIKGEDGSLISADDYVGKGPVLLVFFRGFW